MKDKKELFKSLIKNKAELIEKKKSAIKHTDAISIKMSGITKPEGIATKEVVEGEQQTDSVKVKAVINTTNFLDSHGDVHIDGIWDKHLAKNPRVLHLQEHELAFDKIISEAEDLEVKVETFTWKELGYDYEGTTQGLVFNSNVKKDRNSFMYNQYSNGYVKNHSVGMIYREVQLAIDDPDYKEEYEVWLEHYESIANKELAKEEGYFFAVLEADAIEGSAVPVGSNTITPTLSEDNEVKITVSLTKEQVIESAKKAIEDLEEEINSEETQETEGNTLEIPEKTEEETQTTDELIDIERERENETLTLIELE